MRFIINQHIKPEEMVRKEPNKTKSLSFVSDRTNMYLLKMGGGVALVHTSAEHPDKAWEGLIFDKDSVKLIDNMIAGLEFIKKNREKLFQSPRPPRTSKENL